MATPVHQPVWTSTRQHQAQWTQEHRAQSQEGCAEMEPEGDERKSFASDIKHGAQRRGYPGAQNWNSGLKMSTKRTGGHAEGATRTANVQERQAHGDRRASRATMAATTGWRTQPRNGEGRARPAFASAVGTSTRPWRAQSDDATSATAAPQEEKVRRPVRTGQSGTRPDTTRAEQTTSPSEQISPSLRKDRTETTTPETPRRKKSGKTLKEALRS